VEDYTEVVKPDSELPTMLAHHQHCANGKGAAGGGIEEGLLALFLLPPWSAIALQLPAF